MKTCLICKTEYSEGTEVCVKCGSKLEHQQETSIGPSDYEEGY